MNSLVRRNYERGQRCDVVNDARAEDFVGNDTWTTQTTNVKEGLGKLAALDVEKASSTGKSQHGTAGREQARTTLSELVDSVADTAEVIALDRPNVKGMFERPGKDHSDATLVATARSFADRAATIVGLFVGYALPATFVNELRSGADLLDSYISTQREGVSGRIEANASAREEVRTLNEALQRLNVIYQNKYRDSPSVLAQWESAYHLEAAPRSRRKTQTNGNG